MAGGGFLRDFEPFRTASGPSRRVTRRWRRHAAATPSPRPHESLRTASRPRSAQGELLLRYPRILETRVIINRPSDVAVADPECKADSAANCVQARGNPLMGVFRNGVNLGMEGYLVRKSLLSDTETETEAATDRRVTENHYPSDDNPYDSLYPVRSRRFEVLRRLHAIDATRLHQRRRWVVSGPNLS